MADMVVTEATAVMVMAKDPLILSLTAMAVTVVMVATDMVTVTESVLPKRSPTAMV